MTHAARGIGILALVVLMVMLALSSTYTSFIGLTQDSARGLELQRQSDLYAEKARIGEMADCEGSAKVGARKNGRTLPRHS